MEGPDRVGGQHNGTLSNDSQEIGVDREISVCCHCGGPENRDYILHAVDRNCIVEEGEEMKRMCSMCGQVKEESEFRDLKKRKYCYCNDCQKFYMRHYMRTYRERIREHEQPRHEARVQRQV